MSTIGLEFLTEEDRKAWEEYESSRDRLVAGAKTPEEYKQALFRAAGTISNRVVKTKALEEITTLGAATREYQRLQQEFRFKRGSESRLVEANEKAPGTLSGELQGVAAELSDFSEFLRAFQAGDIPKQGSGSSAREIAAQRTSLGSDMALTHHDRMKESAVLTQIGVTPMDVMLDALEDRLPRASRALQKRVADDPDLRDQLARYARASDIYTQMGVNRNEKAEELVAIGEAQSFRDGQNLITAWLEDAHAELTESRNALVSRYGELSGRRDPRGRGNRASPFALPDAPGQIHDGVRGTADDIGRGVLRPVAPLFGKEAVASVNITNPRSDPYGFNVQTVTEEFAGLLPTILQFGLAGPVAGAAGGLAARAGIGKIGQTAVREGVRFGVGESLDPEVPLEDVRERAKRAAISGGIGAVGGAVGGKIVQVLKARKAAKAAEAAKVPARISKIPERIGKIPKRIPALKKRVEVKKPLAHEIRTGTGKKTKFGEESPELTEAAKKFNEALAGESTFRPKTPKKFFSKEGKPPDLPEPSKELSAGLEGKPLPEDVSLKGLNQWIAGRAASGKAKNIVTAPTVEGRQLAEELRKASGAVTPPKVTATEILAIPRTMITSGELSGSLRQGAPVAPRFWRQWGQSMNQQFASLRSKDVSNAFRQALKADTEFENRKIADLAMTAVAKGGKITQFEEELLAKNLIERVLVGEKRLGEPGKLLGRYVGATNRAYEDFLTKLRVEVYDEMMKLAVREKAVSGKFNAKAYQALKGNIAELRKKILSEKGTKADVKRLSLMGEDLKAMGKDLKVMKDVAEVVNWLTGRGSVPKGVGGPAATVMFSPRFFSSALKIMSPWTYINPKTSAFARKQAFKTVGAYAVTGNALMAAAMFGGAKVVIDTNNSDFGKIRLGKTRIDIWRGLNQYPRLISQLRSGTKVSPVTGKARRVSTAETLGGFFVNKFAPVPRFLAEWIDGKDWDGTSTPRRLGESVITSSLIPIFLQDVHELVKEDPTLFGLNDSSPATLSKFFGMSEAKVLALSAGSFFGLGTQTFPIDDPIRELEGLASQQEIALKAGRKPETRIDVKRAKELKRAFDKAKKLPPKQRKKVMALLEKQAQAILKRAKK
jgi:hypothetical protein